MNNSQLLEKEEQSYFEVIETMRKIVVTERDIDYAEERSAKGADERKNLDDEQTSIGSNSEREEINGRYKRELKTQVELQNRRVGLLERLGAEIRKYEESRASAQNEIEVAYRAIQREDTRDIEQHEYEQEMRQTLQDLSGARKDYVADILNNNPDWKRFAAMDSSIGHHETPGEKLTRIGLANDISFKHAKGEDIIPALAAHLGGPVRGLQAALREMENPEEVAKTARKIIERLGADSENSKEAPESDEVTFAKTLLLSKRAEERYELVNGKMKANAIPLQIALGDIADSKWDKVCIEALKGHGENSTRTEADRGQFLTTGKPPQKVKLTPREQELAFIAKLPRMAEEPNIVSTDCLPSERSKVIQGPSLPSL